MAEQVKIIECPRDAMQGIRTFIPTPDKISYLKSLLLVGFDTIDIGSFVSPKSIPQMADTADVLNAITGFPTQSKLLVIVANLRGAEEALSFSKVDYLGFPFSISENFQMRNTHKSIEESVVVLSQILKLTAQAGKKVVVYLSMGFGNPYGDTWSLEIVSEWIAKLTQMGVKIISLSDTVGVATPNSVTLLFKHLIALYPDIEFGAHFHTRPSEWYDKIEAAYTAGCRRFDGAIMGIGGCPMAMDHLTGNMPTEKLVSFFTKAKAEINVAPHRFERAYNAALEIFKPYK